MAGLPSKEGLRRKARPRSAPRRKCPRHAQRRSVRRRKWQHHDGRRNNRYSLAASRHAQRARRPVAHHPPHKDAPHRRHRTTAGREAADRTSPDRPAADRNAAEIPKSKIAGARRAKVPANPSERQATAPWAKVLHAALPRIVKVLHAGQIGTIVTKIMSCSRAMGSDNSRRAWERPCTSA